MSTPGAGSRWRPVRPRLVTAAGFAWLAGPGVTPAAAQAGAGESWGRSPAYVAARLLVAAGFEQVATKSAGFVRSITYGNTNDPTVGLVFTFRRDSLVALARYVLVKNAWRVAPDPGWRPLGPGVWAIATENTRLTRRVEGLFLCDDMHPLRNP